MHVAPGRRFLLVAVLSAVALAAVASGITYAATSTTTATLHACANRAGTLRLLQHGKCPSGYAKVSLNRQGPRGLTGPAGPGAFTMRAVTDSSTTAVVDRALPGMGLTAHVLCAVGTGSQSALYLEDVSGTTAYTVNGSADQTSSGAHATLVYDTGSHGNLPNGPSLVEITQPADLHANSELVLQSDTSAGGQLSADVVATRAGKKAIIHLYLFQSGTHCVAQAEVTPAT